MSRTVRAAFRETVKALPASETPELDARALIKHISGLDDACLIAAENRLLTAEESRRLEQAIKRRAMGEPISQIVGYREFWGMRFDVAPGVLTPRPDSETLIEAVLTRRSDRQSTYHILDLGLGSGCLLGALMSEFRKAKGVGVDIDQAAIDLAQRNFRRLGLSDRVSCLQSDWCDALSGAFDIIVSNPPYIKDGDRETLPIEVRAYENEKALFAGNDGLDAYRRLSMGIGSLLAPGGMLVLEAGAGQADDIARLFVADRPEWQVEFEKDLAGHRRAVILQTG